MTNAAPNSTAACAMQTAFIVTDIRTAIVEFTGLLNAGPWFLRERGIFANQTYRGQPVQTQLSIAMAYSGDMLFELIQQHDDGPSVYRDQIAARGYGLHHFGIGSDDYARDCAAYAARGHVLVYEAEVAHGAKVGYFEHPGHCFMIEVIELRPQSRQMFAGFRQAHREWQGGVEIRPLAPARATGPT
jgi:hypothetical protein